MTTQTTITGNYARISVGDYVTDGSGWAYKVLGITDGMLYFGEGLPAYPTFYRVVDATTLGPRNRVTETTKVR